MGMNQVQPPVFSKGDVKSKVTKSAKFGGGRWQVSRLARAHSTLCSSRIHHHTTGRSYFMRIRVLPIPPRTSTVLALVDM
jgi:hypothetical protein